MSVEAVSNFLLKIFGSKNERVIKSYLPVVESINAMESDIKALSDSDLAAQTHKLKSRHQSGESLKDLLPEAFATVREATWRTLGMRHFDVQLIGGMVLHEGNIAEMKTGEGKNPGRPSGRISELINR